MLKLYVKVQAWMKSEEGQGMVEYAMIIGLVAVGVLALLGTMGTEIKGVFTKINGSLNGVNNPTPPAGQ